MARFVEGLPFHTPLYSPFDLSRRRHNLFGQMLAGTLPEARDRTARTDRRAQNPSGTEDRGAYARHPLLPLSDALRPPAVPDPTQLLGLDLLGVVLSPGQQHLPCRPALQR